MVDSNKAFVADQIDRFVNKYKKCQVLISSRPESIVSALPSFKTVSLATLSIDEIPVVIEKFSRSPDVARELIAEIAATSSSMPSLLTTPLMVALLVFKYSKTKLFPETAAEFYDDLFEVLLVTHDNTKIGGVDRDRKCMISENSMRQVFDTFSFATRYDGLASFSRQEVIKYSTIALEKQAVNNDPEDFVSDIEKITCLLLKEGTEYKYVHKSVQEYHASCYIRDMDDVLANKFYSKMKRSHQAWRVELSFLESIDERRFYSSFGYDQLKLAIPEENSSNSEFSLDLNHCSPHIKCEMRLFNSEGKLSIDRSPLYLSLNSNLYYIPRMRHVRAPSGTSNWRLLCESIGANPNRKLRISHTEILSSKFVTQQFETIANGYYKTRFRLHYNSLHEKLNRASALHTTKSVVETNPFV